VGGVGRGPAGGVAVDEPAHLDVESAPIHDEDAGPGVLFGGDSLTDRARFVLCEPFPSDRDPWAPRYRKRFPGGDCELVTERRDPWKIFVRSL
jgi:hypothetical protein